jgi:hypothetical protein
VIRRLLLALAVIGAVLATVVVLLLPSRALPAASTHATLAWPVVRGAFHVHSRRSDGTGTLDELAAAAARAGLQFVVVTDHGDGTRAPEPPAYRSGVLMIDGVEISTNGGHYVALNLPKTPYPLAGDAVDVVDDVRRFGGFGFAAHPGSPKPALRWHDWSASFDGVEWLNADSEWRDEVWGSLGRVLLTYAFRPVETLGALLDRPADVIAHIDRIAARRHVVTIAGADAHARLGYRQSTDPYEDVVIARVPSYDVSFRAFVNHVIVRQALSGNAATDADLITAAIRGGHGFTSIDSLAVLGAFEMKATSGGTVVRPGEYLEVAGPVEIVASIAAPQATTLALLRNGELVYETREPTLRIDVGTEPGAYRVEARLPTQQATAIPWVFTNPIYVGLAAAHVRYAAEAAAPAQTRSPVATEAWTAEASPGSASALQPITLDDGTPAIEWRFELAPGARDSQYAAMRFPVSSGLAPHDRVQLRARSDRPRRVWAQLRTADGERWGKSFYVDSELQPIELRFAEFRPFDAASAAVPPLERIDSLLLVIDTMHTAPGSAGRVAITDLWFAR